VRIPTKIATLLLAALVIRKLTACSISEICPHHGFAAAKNFTVTVQHAGKPLPGVLVKAIPDNIDELDIAGTTEAAGSILFENLPPGNYHLSVSMLGITSTYLCFHGAKWAALNAKRTMTVNWGDDAAETRQPSGKLLSRHFIVDANGQHLDPTSASGIHFTLTNALTGMQLQTTSNSEGLIAFGSIADGVYVLHADGDDSRHYSSGDLLIRVESAAARAELMLTLSSGGGSCYGPLVLAN
jgi:hypothetical protein